jgi:hypothetical protein
MDRTAAYKNELVRLLCSEWFRVCTFFVQPPLMLSSNTFEAFHVCPGHSGQTERFKMPKDAHTKAAEHHEAAAKTHRTAAQQHGSNDHASGKQQSAQAQQQSKTAHQQSDEAHGKSQQQK